MGICLLPIAVPNLTGTVIIGSSIPIYTWTHFIHISETECNYTFNYKDHWDPGLFTLWLKCFILRQALGCSSVVFSDQLLGARNTWCQMQSRMI